VALGWIALASAFRSYLAKKGSSAIDAIAEVASLHVAGSGASIYIRQMDAARKLYCHLRYDLKIQYLLPILLIVPVLIVFWRDPFDTYSEAGTPVTAEITKLSVGWNRYQGKTPGLELSASTSEGAMGTKIVLPKDVAGCKVGDEIHAEQVGLKLYLQPAPCVTTPDP